MLCCPHCLELLSSLNNIVTPDSVSTILFNVDNNYEQCGQHNTVQSCSTVGSEFLAVYVKFEEQFSCSHVLSRVLENGF